MHAFQLFVSCLTTIEWVPTFKGRISMYMQGEVEIHYGYIYTTGYDRGHG
jgi:hypothetical protein